MAMFNEDGLVFQLPKKGLCWRYSAGGWDSCPSPIAGDEDWDELLQKAGFFRSFDWGTDYGGLMVEVYHRLSSSDDDEPDPEEWLFNLGSAGIFYQVLVVGLSSYLDLLDQVGRIVDRSNRLDLHRDKEKEEEKRRRRKASDR